RETRPGAWLDLRRGARGAAAGGSRGRSGTTASPDEPLDGRIWAGHPTGAGTGEWARRLAVLRPQHRPRTSGPPEPGPLCSEHRYAARPRFPRVCERPPARHRMDAQQRGARGPNRGWNTPFGWNTPRDARAASRGEPLSDHAKTASNGGA